jgi:hypothetical protein
MDLLGGIVMIGSRKLSTIREEIEKALASTGGDPIQRLEQQIASAKHRGEHTDVMEGLKRFLKSRRKQKRRKNPARTKR